ncbi:hypothetical protein [Campylobacter vulpis]|nr:hypothetical protein [Campylobacter vulpis]
MAKKSKKAYWVVLSGNLKRFQLQRGCPLLKLETLTGFFSKGSKRFTA